MRYAESGNRASSSLAFSRKRKKSRGAVDFTVTPLQQMPLNSYGFTSGCFSLVCFPPQGSFARAANAICVVNQKGLAPHANRRRTAPAPAILAPPFISSRPGGGGATKITEVGYTAVHIEWVITGSRVAGFTKVYRYDQNIEPPVPPAPGNPTFASPKGYKIDLVNGAPDPNRCCWLWYPSIKCEALFYAVSRSFERLFENEGPVRTVARRTDALHATP